MRNLIKVFKALSDPNRVRILKMLGIRPLCVCEITEILQLAPSTVSKHLSLLRDVDLILDTKDGKWVNYELNKSSQDYDVKEVLELLARRLDKDKIVADDLKIVQTVDREVICRTHTE